MNDDASNSDSAGRAVIEARVRALVDTLVGTSGSIEVSSHAIDIEVMDVTPHEPRAPKMWICFSDNIVVKVGEKGGIWEFEYDAEDYGYLAQLLTSVVAGRVEEVFAPARSMVEVTLDDGEILRETGYDWVALLCPLPFWRRWGRRVTYGPYAQSS